MKNPPRVHPPQAIPRLTVQGQVCGSVYKVASAQRLDAFIAAAAAPAAADRVVEEGSSRWRAA
jgi:hypothetical protein